MKKFGFGNQIHTRFTLEEIQKLFDDVIEKDGHWIWVGSKNTFGYGHTWWRGKWEYPHRLFYALFRGWINFGDDIHHKKKCQIKLCCNPYHLRRTKHSDHSKAHNQDDLPF